MTTKIERCHKQGAFGTQWGNTFQSNNTQLKKKWTPIYQIQKFYKPKQREFNQEGKPDEQKHNMGNNNKSRIGLKRGN